MGQTQSSPASPSSSSQAQGPSSPEANATTIRLYKFHPASGGGAWELESESVSPKFFDANEDAANGKASWVLEAGDAEVPVSDQFQCEEVSRRVTLVSPGGLWALRFPTAFAYQQFVSAYNDKLFENTYGVENDDKNRAKIFGADSVLNMGATETNESRAQWAEDMDVEEEPEPAVRGDKAVGTPKRNTIHSVRVGAGDRSYLVRDKTIDVLKNVYGGVQDTGVSFDVTPPRGGSSFTPSRLLLAKRERRMNMLSAEKGESLFHTDIETGKIVSEWGFRKDGVDVAMRDIVNDTKAAQMDERDTFLGVGKNRLVRWDMRAAEGIVQEMNSPSVLGYGGGHDYKTQVNFNCMATSGDGYIVIGSEDGQVRLYSEKTLTRASTAIPGLGAPITGVDVTFDGKWVVATTNKYIMVVKTTFKDKKNKETNGFKSRMGANAPAPRLLRLKAEDNVLVGNAPLRQGKFTWVTESGRQERWIVASCGNYTVLWNFRQVKLAKPDVVSYGGLTTCTEYHLIPKEEDVVDSVFMHDNYTASPGGNESSMVVVTKHQVWSLAGEDEEN